MNMPNKPASLADDVRNSLKPNRKTDTATL